MLGLCFLLALFAGILLTGCSSATPASAPAPAPAPAPTASSAPAAQPAPTASANAQATQGEYPGITVAIQELKRSSNTLTLKLTVINQSPNSFAFDYNFGEGTLNVKDFASIGGIHLIDAANKKKYFVVRDSDGACVCSRSIANIAPGSQSVVWAKFPAPPEDVQKITVEIPHFPPFEDVPTSR